MRGDFYHLQVYWYLCDEVEKRAVLYVVTSDIGAIKHKKEVNEIRKNRTEQNRTKENIPFIFHNCYLFIFRAYAHNKNPIHKIIQNLTNIPKIRKSKLKP